MARTFLTLTIVIVLAAITAAATGLLTCPWIALLVVIAGLMALMWDKADRRKPVDDLPPGAEDEMYPEEIT